MIDKNILKEIGFKKGIGWDHEVWVYDGEFWVHFGGEFSGLDGAQISSDAGMKDFFSMFIENIKHGVMENARVIF